MYQPSNSDQQPYIMSQPMMVPAGPPPPGAIMQLPPGALPPGAQLLPDGQIIMPVVQSAAPVQPPQQKSLKEHTKDAMAMWDQIEKNLESKEEELMHLTQRIQSTKAANAEKIKLAVQQSKVAQNRSSASTVAARINQLPSLTEVDEADVHFKMKH